MSNAISNPPYWEQQRGGGKLMDLMKYRGKMKLERDLKRIRAELKLYIAELGSLTSDEKDEMADLIAEECELMEMLK